jgi:hypothetical protein
MTITKKLLQTSITILAIAGMVLISTPASAGFFDWFGATPLSQEAVAIRYNTWAEATDACKGVTNGAFENSAGYWCDTEGSGLVSGGGDTITPVRAVELKEKPSAATSFFKTFFSRSSDSAKSIIPSGTPPYVPTTPTADRRQCPTGYTLENGNCVKLGDYNPNTPKSVTVPGNSTIPILEPGSDYVYCSTGGCGAICQSHGYDGAALVTGGSHAGSYLCVNSLSAAPTVNNGGETNTEISDFKETIKRGDAGTEVLNLQRVLKSLGYYKTSIDGQYGPGTQSAVKAFQRANGQVFTTGNTIGPKTRANLNSEVSNLKGQTKIDSRNSNPIGDIDPIKDVAWVVHYSGSGCSVQTDAYISVGSGSTISNTDGSTAGCLIGTVLYN